MAQKKPVAIMSRGYETGKERFLKGARYNMSCYSCGWYFMAEGDDHEMCQNPDVLKFDMVVTDTNVYCNKWAPNGGRLISAKNLMRGIITNDER